MFCKGREMASTAKKSQLNQRRKPKQARSLAKYNAVLDACSRVLSTHAYANITMTEFCLESGLPYATVYQYFENKDDIMVAWMTRLFDQIEQQLVSQKKVIEAQTQGKDSDKNLTQFVFGLVKISITILASQQASVRELLNGMPQVLTSKLLMVAEDKTVMMVNELFAQRIAKSDFPDLEYHLRMLTKMLLGFFLQSLLTSTNALDAKRDGEEIAFLVSVYLKERGIINP